jgi:UDP-N-acetylmuramate dehydrogenase
MQIQSSFSLKNLNTFGIDQTAEAFVSVETETALKEVLSLKEYPSKFILGGGSNLLLTRSIEGLTIHVNTKGIRVITETEETVTIEAMAGENWHDFVQWGIEQGYGGMENLSLIPGNVGTASIQNIGAYGVELKDIFVSCSAIAMHDLHEKEFNLEEATFGYRSSIFKTSVKGKYVITRLRVCLTKSNHKLNTAYGAIKEALGDLEETPKNIAAAVVSIRQSKLPDPKEIGNSGSFFKNPVVSLSHYNELQKQHSTIPSYPINKEQVKIPAGWLIDSLGFKGYRKGDAGVHKKQALVLVNYGSATGKEILALAETIQQRVKEDFDISLEAEVNII